MSATTAESPRNTFDEWINTYHASDGVVKLGVSALVDRFVCGVENVDGAAGGPAFATVKSHYTAKKYYRVSVYTNGNNLLRIECPCLAGEACKHGVAALAAVLLLSYELDTLERAQVMIPALKLPEYAIGRFRVAPLLSSSLPKYSFGDVYSGLTRKLVDHLKDPQFELYPDKVLVTAPETTSLGKARTNSSSLREKNQLSARQAAKRKLEKRSATSSASATSNEKPKKKRKNTNTMNKTGHNSAQPVGDDDESYDIPPSVRRGTKSRPRAE